MNYEKFTRRTLDRKSNILFSVFAPLTLLVTFNLVSGWLYILCITAQVLIIIADTIWLYYYMPKYPDAPRISLMDYVITCIEGMFFLIILLTGFIDKKNLFPVWINEFIWGWVIIVLAYFALAPGKK